jgi:hypothetical protein
MIFFMRRKGDLRPGVLADRRYFDRIHGQLAALERIMLGHKIKVVVLARHKERITIVSEGWAFQAKQTQEHREEITFISRHVR